MSAARAASVPTRSARAGPAERRVGDAAVRRATPGVRTVSAAAADRADPRFARAVVDWYFDHVAATLGDNPTLPYTVRQDLLRSAHRLGIGRFHANLLIAVAHHQLPRTPLSASNVSRGGPIPMLNGETSFVPPVASRTPQSQRRCADAAMAPKAASIVPIIAGMLAVECLIGLAIWFMLSRM